MEFSGTQDDAIQPTEFLKTINHSLMGLGTIPSDEQRITTVSLWLKSESPAEEWFNDTATPKVKYPEFEQSFKQHFLNVEKIKKTKLELERELAEMRIKMEDLGTMEKYRGEDIYTHTVRQLARSFEGEDTRGTGELDNICKFHQSSRNGIHKGGSTKAQGEGSRGRED